MLDRATGTPPQRGAVVASSVKLRLPFAFLLFSLLFNCMREGANLRGKLYPLPLQPSLHVSKIGFHVSLYLVCQYSTLLPISELQSLQKIVIILEITGFCISFKRDEL